MTWKRSARGFFHRLLILSFSALVLANCDTQEELELSYTEIKAPVTGVSGEAKVKVYLTDGSLYPHTGTVSFIDPTFNSDTGTFMIKAELANPDALLRPGMFLKAVMEGATRPNALTVLNANRSLFSSQLDYVQTQTTAFTSLIDVYRAMGGGWVDEADRMSETAAPYVDAVAGESSDMN